MNFTKIVIASAVFSFGFVASTMADTKGGSAEYFLRESCLINKKNPVSVLSDPAPAVDAAPLISGSYTREQRDIGKKVFSKLTADEKSKCHEWQHKELHEAVEKYK